MQFNPIQHICAPNRWDDQKNDEDNETLIRLFNQNANKYGFSITLSEHFETQFINDLVPLINNLLQNNQMILTESLLKPLIPIYLAIDIELYRPFFNRSHFEFDVLSTHYPFFYVFKYILFILNLRSTSHQVIFSKDHLLSLPPESIFFIHSYFIDPNLPVELQTLALSFILPSTYFDSEIPFSIPKMHLLLPDPIIILENYEHYSKEDFIYASYLLQSCNGLILTIGQNDSILTIDEIMSIHQILLFDQVSLASMCRSIVLMLSFSTTSRHVINFFRSFNCKCGCELIKELIINNFTKSFRELMAIFSVPIMYVLEEQNNNFTEDFLDIIDPLRANQGNFLRILSKLSITTKPFTYIHILHSLLLKISIIPLSSVYNEIIEYYETILMHFSRLIQISIVYPQIDSTLYNSASIRTLTLFYHTINRLKLTVLSPSFVKNTISLLSFLPFIPVSSNSYLEYEIKEIYEAIKETIRTHNKLFEVYIENYLSPIFYVGAAICGLTVEISPRIVILITEHLIKSSLGQIFHILLKMLLKYVQNENVFSMFLDLYFPIIEIELQTKYINNKKIRYLLLLYKCLSKHKSIINVFFRHISCELLIKNAIKYMKIEKRPNLVIELEILICEISILNGFQTNLKLGDLEVIMNYINLLSSKSSTAILNLIIFIAKNRKKAKNFPFEIKWKRIFGSKAKNIEWFRNEYISLFGAEDYVLELEHEEKQRKEKDKTFVFWMKKKYAKYLKSNFIMALNPIVLPQSQIIYEESE